MRILVTGGAGYIGSHTVLLLLEADHTVHVIDNYCNSSDESLKRVQALVGADRAARLTWEECDLLHEDKLKAIFDATTYDAVVHFAGLKAVGESVAQPLSYYDNNVTGSVHLLRQMELHNCWNLVFSSSATVYGTAEPPITEDFPLLRCTNPYGRSKFFIEEICRDLIVSNDKWRIILLRYFNPTGAHPSGQIGEDPSGIPNNLMPYVAQVAAGVRPFLTVFGGDYETKDGTGVRDFIHVMDLGAAHVCALEKLWNPSSGHPLPSNCTAINVGTGTGYTVLEMVKAMEIACGHEIPYKIGDRRPGDLASVYSDPALSEKLLGWTAKYGLQEMVADMWKWQSSNPNGYKQ